MFVKFRINHPIIEVPNFDPKSSISCPRDPKFPKLWAADLCPGQTLEQAPERITHVGIKRDQYLHYLDTLPIYPSIHQPIYPFVYLSIYLSICLSVCLSVCISIYLSIFLSLSSNLLPYFLTHILLPFCLTILLNNYYTI
jgi:hypothetical protein